MALLRRIVESIDRKFYPGYIGESDDVLYGEMLRSLMRPDYTVLDVGAGSGIRTQARFRGEVARICGVDPDPRVSGNPDLDEGRVGTAEAIPYPDAHFDLAYTWYVVEHLPDPERVFREVARTLKPGGLFLIKTPNLWHYVTMTSRLLPHALHEFIITRIFHREREDVFPTVYRCNTEGEIRRLAAATGFHVREIRFLEPRPEYVRFSPLTYLFGVAYERFVNSTNALRKFRVVLIAVLEKQ